MRTLQQGPEKFKYGIVLTGGIGTGKSSVASLLKLYGYRVIDGDQVAREVFQRKKGEIERIFGTSDRRELRKRVFQNREELEKLEGVLAPEIRREILERAQREEERGVPYFVEIPLYFEKGGREGPYSQFQWIVMVYAPREVQINRVVARDRVSPAEVEKILENQLDIEEKRGSADFVLENLGGMKGLQREVEGLLKWVEKVVLSRGEEKEKGQKGGKGGGQKF
ncbi:MAG: dephospho-CoA kinase [Campylobacterales bacterium]